MKRFVACLSLAALVASSGCCGSRQCSPCGPCGGGMGYGAGYAPAFSAPSSCPNGNCGAMYQSGAVASPYQQAYVPGTTQAYASGMPQAYAPYSSTASLDYLQPF